MSIDGEMFAMEAMSGYVQINTSILQEGEEQNCLSSPKCIKLNESKTFFFFFFPEILLN